MKIPIMPLSLTEYQAKPQSLIDDLVDMVGEDVNSKHTFALRGIRSEELGKKELENSYSSPDGEIERQLDGTCGLLLAGDWNYDPSSAIKNNFSENSERVLQYGATDYIAIICGNLLVDEDFNDIGEVVLGDAETVAYIRR
ncbi:MAG: hypothetical protein ACYC4H_00865 [Desulfocucumaceae bacterium]